MTAASVASAGGNSRMRRWLLPGVMLALLLLLVVLAYRTTPQVDRQPYELESRGPYGLRALRESLRAMGYTVRDLRGEALALPQDADLLLSWPGLQEWTEDELLTLRRWVASGRSAMFVVDQYDRQIALEDFGVDAYFGGFSAFESVNQSQPALLDAPPALNGEGGAIYLDMTRRVVQLTATDDTEWRATLGVEQVGQGWIWYVSDYHALTNANLRAPDQTAVLAAILRDVPDGGVIYFNAFHLYGSQGTQAEEASRLRTLQQWLYFTPAGQATLLALVVGVIGWVMAGRRLGPPLKTARELRRREGAEYVRAIAGLKRRARAYEDIIQRQTHRLKLALGKPRRIPATLEDARFLDALRYSGDADPSLVDEAGALLKQLREVTSEEELVKAAAAVDEWLSRKP